MSLLTIILGEHGPHQAPAEGVRLDQLFLGYKQSLSGYCLWHLELGPRD